MNTSKITLKNVVVENLEMSNVVDAYEKMVASINARVFDANGYGVQVPYFVTLQKNAGKRLANAWVSTYKAWHSFDGKDAKELAYELNIATDMAGRSFDSMFLTICHELIHLYNLEFKVQDTSRNGTYHNEQFADVCNCLKLVTTKDKKYGYGIQVPMGEWKQEIIDAYNLVLQDVADVQHLICSLAEKIPSAAKKDKKKSNQIKYSCPMCKASFRSTSRIKSACLECSDFKANKIVLFVANEGEESPTLTTTVPATDSVCPPSSPKEDNSKQIDVDAHDNASVPAPVESPAPTVADVPTVEDKPKATKTTKTTKTTKAKAPKATVADVPAMAAESPAPAKADVVEDVPAKTTKKSPRKKATKKADVPAKEDAKLVASFPADDVVKKEIISIHIADCLKDDSVPGYKADVVEDVPTTSIWDDLATAEEERQAN